MLFKTVLYQQAWARRRYFFNLNNFQNLCFYKLSLIQLSVTASQIPAANKILNVQWTSAWQFPYLMFLLHLAWVGSFLDAEVDIWPRLGQLNNALCWYIVTGLWEPTKMMNISNIVEKRMRDGEKQFLIMLFQSPIQSFFFLKIYLTYNIVKF